MAGLGLEASQRVEGLAGEDEVAHIERAVIAPAAELPGLGSIIPPVVHHAEAALGFRQYRSLAGLLSDFHRLLIRRDRVVQAAGAVVGPSNPEQVAGWAKLRIGGLRKSCGEPFFHRQYAIAYLEK